MREAHESLGRAKDEGPVHPPPQPEPSETLAEGVNSRVEEKTEPKQRQWQNGVAGAMAGMTTVATLHPLDMIRTRFQVHDGRDARLPSYRGTTHAFATIARTEGLRGLYAGLYPALVGSTLSWGLYFYLYSRAKARYERWQGGGQLSAGLHLVSAAEAGSLVCVLSNPVWVAKTRLQLQVHEAAAAIPGSSHGRPAHYLGFVDVLRRVVREEGVRGLYRGLGPSLILVSHGALQFMAYEEGKKVLAGWKLLRQPTGGGPQQAPGGSATLTSGEYATLGAASKSFAALITYPYQVVRSRLQQRPDEAGQAKYRDSLHVFRDTLRYEGWRGFYKGFIPNILRVMPASSLTFLVYETTLRALKGADR